MGRSWRGSKKVSRIIAGQLDDDALVEAARSGIAYNDFITMSEAEIAAYARGSRLRTLDWYRWFRWMTAAIMQPHVKKSIDPQKLIDLEKEMQEKAPVQAPDKERLKQMEEVFKKWDSENM